MPKKPLNELTERYMKELKQSFSHFWNKATNDPEFVRGAPVIDDYIREFLATDIWLTPDGQKLEEELSKIVSTTGHPNHVIEQLIPVFDRWVKHNFEAPKSLTQEVEEWTGSPGPLAEYEQFLMTGDYDKAREAYKNMDPELKELADEIARKRFAGSLRGLSHALVQKGHISEARQLMATYLKIPVFEKKPG